MPTAPKSKSKDSKKAASKQPAGSVAVRHFLHVPIEAVYEAFLEPTLIRGWLAPEDGVEIDVERAVGGPWGVSWQLDEAASISGRVEQLQLMQHIQVAWEGGGLEVKLEPGLGGTHLNLDVTGSPRLADATARLDLWFSSLRT